MSFRSVRVYPLEKYCLMQSKLKSKRGIAHVDNDQQHSISKQVYDVGSYVMARWRNSYEYLAEVLAFRHRSRDHPEYRVKFSWDNIIEWTPATSIRRAEQHEINFVLKFIRQHRPSDLVKKESTEEHEKKQVTDANDDDTNDTAVAKGDMLYDRSIAQFHEACRKRRELKKRAAPGELEGPKPEKVSKLETPVLSPRPLPKVTKPESHGLTPKRLFDTARKLSSKPYEVVDLAVPSQTIPPITFQCPHCPRKMRRQSLLTAHLLNYHNKNSVQSLPVVESTPAPKKKKLEPETETQPPPTVVQPGRYVFCSACKFSGPSTELETNVIQCIVCRVWSHRRCTSQNTAKSWICNSCHRAPSLSGLTDWATQITNSDEVETTKSNCSPSLTLLMRETMSLISWLHHLNKLIMTGRHTLCRIRSLTGGGSAEDVSGSSEVRSTVATSNAPKESSADSTTTDLAMDFPFISGPHTVSGEEHLSALESTDITRILANLSSSSPEDLPDLMTAISEDLLNVPTTTHQSHSAVQVPSGSLGQTAPSLPHPPPNTIFDTPTKTLLASLEQVLYQGGGNNGKHSSLPTATTIEADLQRPLPIDAPSPFFITPVKNFRSASTSVSDIEAAASLIGFAESSSRIELSLPTPSVVPSHDEIKSQRVSSDLDCLQSEILVPLEEMISLIESRLDVIESQVAQIQGDQAVPSPHSNMDNSAVTDGDDGDYGGSVSALSRASASSRSSLSSSSRSPSPSSPQEGGGDTQPTAAVYPHPKFVPKRRNTHRSRY